MVNSILSLPAIVRSVLVALLAAESLVDAQLATSTKATFANTTSRTTSSSASKVTQNCCFFLQDTISEYWWEAYGTTIFNQVVNLTSITQYLTPLPNGTVTSFKTNVYTTNATFTQSSLIGQDPVSLYGNNAPGPVESTTVLPANGDKTVVGPATVTSPAAFFVYNTVKVITAAPVTNSNGDLVCGTVFSLTSVGDVTFSGVNSNAQAYWGGSNIAGPSISQLPGSVATTTFTNSARKTESASTVTNTYTMPKSTTLYTNSAGQLVTASRQAGVTITLDAPFVYQPPLGATGKTGEIKLDPNCNWGTDSILYGMTPQTLIDYMIKKPALSSQYPGLESCGIAYPSILRTTACSAHAGHTEGAGGDLTSSTVIIVGVTSSAASGVLTTIPAAQSQTQSATEQPTTSAQPTTSPAAVSSAQPTSVPVPVSSQEPATPVQPTTQVQPTTSQQAPSPESSASPVSAPVSVPVSSQEPAPVSSQQPASSQAPAISSQNPASTLQPISVSSPQPTTTPPANIGSIIGSLVGLSPASTPTTAQVTTVPILATVPLNTASPISGSTTVISGVTNVVYTSSTAVPFLPVPTLITTPVNPSSPISGLSTTVISGVTNVVYSTTAVIPLIAVSGSGSQSPVTQAPLPGITTLVSGTVNVVIPGSTTILVDSRISISGETRTSGTQTYVVVTGKTTVPVITSSAAAKGNGTSVVTSSRTSGVLTSIGGSASATSSTVLVAPNSGADRVLGTGFGTTFAAVWIFVGALGLRMF